MHIFNCSFFSVLDRSAGFSIYAFYNDTFDPASPSPNDFVYHHDPLSGCPAAVQNITINRLVRQIVFTNNRPDGFQTNCIGTNSNLYTSIEICEIKVMGKSALQFFFKIYHTWSSSVTHLTN